jgi:23S rRNA pseudouridine1911/1915/1917 synthase
MASIGHPVLGDSLYGGKPGAKFRKMTRQALHAHRLEFHHPISDEWMVFESRIPADMADYLNDHKPGAPRK